MGEPTYPELTRARTADCLERGRWADSHIEERVDALRDEALAPCAELLDVLNVRAVER